MTATHRYIRKIPESVSFWSRHGAQIGGNYLFVCFFCNQNCACHLHLPHSDWKDEHLRNAAWHAKIMDAFVLHLFLCVCVITKTWAPPILAQWLPTLLQGVVYEVWDLPFISVLQQYTIEWCITFHRMLDEYQGPEVYFVQICFILKNCFSMLRELGWLNVTVCWVFVFSNSCELNVKHHMHTLLTVSALHVRC